MSNDYFEASGTPARRAFAASQPIESEYARIEEGFDKLPPLTATYFPRIKSDGSGMEAISPAVLAAYLSPYISVRAAVTGGSVNAYTVSIPTITAYANLLRITLQIHVGNTNSCIFTINALGAKTGCRPDGSDLEDGDLVTGGVYDFVYNSTFGKLQLMNMMPSTIQSSNPTFTSLTTTGDTTIGGSVTTTGAITTPIVKTGLVSVSISAGNLTLDLSAGSAFNLASMSSNSTVTLTNFDATKQVTFSLRVVTTGAFNFTAITMTGVTIHYDENMVGPGVLKASGETLLGFLFTGTDLIVINSNLALY